MLPTKFRFIWPSGFRGEDFKKSVNQKQELSVAAMFVNESGQNEQSLFIYICIQQCPKDTYQLVINAFCFRCQFLDWLNSSLRVV